MPFVKFLAMLLVCCVLPVAGWPEELGDDVSDIPLNENALWLPKKYQSYYIKLVNAAQAALNQPRCIEVRQATLDLHQSTVELPMFRVLCREASGSTYTEMIDGSSYGSLTVQKNFSVECHDLLLEKTKMMYALTWVNSSSQPLEEEGDKSPSVKPVGESQTGELEHYQWDFDAKTPDDVPLAYRADCTVLPSGRLKMEIKARR